MSNTAMLGPRESSRPFLCRPAADGVIGAVPLEVLSNSDLAVPAVFAVRRCITQ